MVRPLLDAAGMRSRTVLLVDPDPRCGRAFAAMLRARGHRVQIARTGSDAVRAARRTSFDLGIVDLFVAGGGVAVAQKLSRSIREVVLSLAARVRADELVESALGFSVCRKGALGRLVDGGGPGRVDAPAPARASPRRRSRPGRRPAF
jgi:CheY-like chemotaxis protein